MINYIGTHNHTDVSNFRLLDSTNKLSALVNKAIELGLSGIAITDHECLSNHVKAIQLQKKLIEDGKDFKIILGDESYLVDSLEEVRDNYQPRITQFFHFIFLAKDEIGYRQLREISTVAWNNSFYTGKMERVPITKQQVESIIGEDKGHLIFQTACIGGELAWCILHDDKNRAIDFIDWCQSVALPENFYLEMQPNDVEEQTKVNKAIIAISEQLGIKTVISTDSHYLTSEWVKIHEAYLKSREDDSREAGDFYRSCYLMSSDEIHQWMDKQIGVEKVNEALYNTIEIGNKIEFFDLEHTQEVPPIPLPEFEQEHSFQNAYGEFEYIKKFAYSDNPYDRYFLQCIENGWWEKEYKEGMSSETIQAMMSRINDELEAIWKSGININDNIPTYYITAVHLEDIMWNKANSLVGDARGSVAAFYVCYLIGLQQINSFEHNIPYWRHLHESRPEMPDVDIDSEKSKRSAIIEAVREEFGADRVLNICAFKTEKSKSAILTCCRAMEVPTEQAQYIAGMIPSIRGVTTSLSVMVNGDDENKPNQEFINECNKYPGLLDMALSIEGLICGRTIHASGVIIFKRPYTELNCMMKSPNGVMVTQYDMDDSAYCGGLKYDFLTIVNLDTMHQCMDLMIKYGYIEDQGSLRATYDKYFAPDVIDYNNQHMWEMAEKHEIINLFQFMTQVGMSAIAKIKPRSLTELCVANAIMRLAGKPGEETPLDRYVRYKNDISQWYDCMHSYNLTDDEIKIMEEHLLTVCGSCSMQEEVMKISMDNRITNYSMKQANALRKLIAKKKVHLQKQAHDDFYQAGRDNGASDNLLNYIWEECITPQLSYSFSLPHVLGYSVIGVQEMNMAATKYPIILWNCANLITDSMSDEEVEGSTDYGSIGKAIAGMQKRGIKIFNPDINQAKFGFEPDISNNAIICGLKSLNGIGDDAAKLIIANRPYKSFDDFCERMISTKIIKNSQMVMLIKAGCFLNLDSNDRFKTMEKYLRKYQYKPMEKLTLSQMKTIETYGIIPEELLICSRYLKFKDYVLSNEGFVENYVDPNKKQVKAGFHDSYYILDKESQAFFEEHFSEESVVRVQNGFYVLSEKKFCKEINDKIQPLREWFASENALNLYNNAAFNEIWNKYASGNEARWSMTALSYYDEEHELFNVDCEKYGIVDFYQMPEQPESYETYQRWINGECKTMPKFVINRIVGCVLKSDNLKHIVTLLTPTGTVDCKLYKESFNFYNRGLFQLNEDGKKTTVEKSWFTRGTLLLISGFRREDMWVPRTYSDSIYKHTICRINAVNPDGSLDIQFERTKI